MKSAPLQKQGARSSTTAEHLPKGKIEKSTHSAVSAAGSLTLLPSRIAQLQRTIGNQAVTQLMTGSASGVVQRVKKENLTQKELAVFNSMSSWVMARPSLSKLFDMETALSHAPDLNALAGFVTYLRDETTSPPLGFDEVKFYKDKVSKYFAKYPAPIEGETPSMSKMVSGGITITNQVSNEETKEVKHTPANPQVPITIGPSAKKHFKHLNKNTTTLPKNAGQLLTYVSQHTGDFNEKNDHWTMQLGDQPTKQPGGGYEIKPWSIIISSDNWQVFHYGPTGTEKD